MYFALAFFIELFLLFLLSKQLTNLLCAFFYKITRSQKITIYLLAVIFFPGTFVHEMAHYLTARLLFVPAFRIEFFPKLEGQYVKLGSVTMQKADFLRRLLIGMAPFFAGTGLLLFVLYESAVYQLFDNPYFVFLIGYLLFEIGNTMFSSRKDMEGAIEVLIILCAITSISYFLGFNIKSLHPEIFFSNPTIQLAFQKGVTYLLFPLGIDLGIIILLKLLV